VSGFVHDLERVANAVLTAEQAAERLTAELASMGVKAQAHAVTHAVTPTVGIWLEPDDDGPIASLPVSEANARTISRLVRCYHDGFRAGRMYGRIDLQRQMRELLGAASTSELNAVRHAIDNPLKPGDL
jgi:hypothetical protein